MKVAVNYHKSLLLCSVEQIFWIWAPGLYVTDGHSALARVSVCLLAAALLEVAACPPGFTGPFKSCTVLNRGISEAGFQTLQRMEFKHLPLPVRSSLGLEVIVTWGQKEKSSIVNLSKPECLLCYTKLYMYLQKFLWLCNSNCNTCFKLFI